MGDVVALVRLWSHVHEDAGQAVHVGAIALAEVGGQVQLLGVLDERVQLLLSPAFPGGNCRM